LWETFAIEHVPVAPFRLKTSATESLSESFAALMLAYAEGDNIDMTEARKVYPFKLISVMDYVEKVPVGHEI
jgi:hypothetical protein